MEFTAFLSCVALAKKEAHREKQEACLGIKKEESVMEVAQEMVDNLVVRCMFETLTP